MQEFIFTTKTDLEALIQNSVSKALVQKNEVNQSPNSFLSITQAAEYLQLAVQTLYGFTSKRTIPFIKKGKRVYFRQADLENWLEGGRKKSKAEITNDLNGKGK